MVHLAKGEIVGFAHDEDVEMHYIETTSILEIDAIDLIQLLQTQIQVTYMFTIHMLNLKLYQWRILWSQTLHSHDA